MSGLTMVDQTYVVDVNKIVMRLDATVTDNALYVNDISQSLVVKSVDAPAVDIYVKKLELEVIPKAFIMHQTFTGEGAVADQDTIIGAGITGDVLRAPDMMRISLRLGEFDTGDAKAEAVTNLGLHIINGGTF